MKKKFTVRLTRQELITIESMLREADDMFFDYIAEGFNIEVEDTDIRPIVPLTAQQATQLAERLRRIEAREAQE